MDMIRTKKDLKACLHEDLKGMSISLRDFVLTNEKWYIYHYIKHMRFIEYYMNSNYGGGN